MPGTPNFALVTEASSPDFTRATVFNEFARQVDDLLLTFKTNITFMVQVRNMLDDSDAGGAPPVGPNNGDAHVVNNWGAGNYVGAYVGAYADGDIAEWNDALAGWVRIVANAAGAPPLGVRVLVGVGAAGSFAGLDDQVAQYNGAWAVPYASADGMRALIIGDGGVWANQTFVYDAALPGWLSTGVSAITLASTWFVDKSGNDTTGSGLLERPLQTINAALAVAAPWDTIIVGQGVYAETLVITGNIQIVERVPGTVFIATPVVGGAVVTVAPAAGGAVVRLSCNITNTSGTGPGDIALHVDNTAGLGLAEVYYNGKRLDGQAGGVALQVDGDPLGMTTMVWVNGTEALVGGWRVGLQNAADFVVFNTVLAAGGLAAWAQVTGVAGRVVMTNFLLGGGAGEILDFGAGGACGVTLSIGSSVIAGVLDLNNAGGAGIVVLTAGTQIAQIVASQQDQVVQKWLGEDEFKICMYRIDANAAAPHIMYAPGVGRVFAPHTARTINRDAIAVPAPVSYSIDGTVPGSVVAPVAPAGGILQGIVNEACLQDAVVAATPLVFSILVPSGAPGFIDAEVIGRLF